MKLLTIAVLLASITLSVPAQQNDLKFLNGNRPVPDAHNCYPYDEQWANRIERALSVGFPVGIEQDLAWFVDPATGKGRVVVDHSAKTNAADPDERQYFFERVRPIIEAQLAHGDPTKWPVIVLHFDFKDVQAPLLHAVWDLLGEYQSWITTAPKSADPHELTKFDRKPLLVLTEDADAQEKVFYDELPAGARLRVFGSAHTHLPTTKDKQQLEHLLATLRPEQLLTEKPTTYRRWWNNSWHEVEEGGQQNAGPWTPAKMARLKALVDHAHNLGYWIRFYTLDGFNPEPDNQNGWFDTYNFGSRQAVEQRWQAALDAGVNLIASDQYEVLAAFMKSHGRR